MPKHSCYVEPFAGSAAVLLQKEPSKHEVINDLDDEVVNFFRVVRHPRLAKRLAAMVEMTPYARTELAAARERKTTPAPLERARQFLIQSYLAFGTNTKSFHYGIDQDYTSRLRNAPRRILDVCTRLRNCIVEQVPALELITRYDQKGTLIYLDPPYLHATRSSSKRYKHEMDDAGHVELIEALNKLKHAKYILSGYPSALYDETLNFTHRYTQTGRTHFNTEREEVIWTNYKPENFLL